MSKNQILDLSVDLTKSLLWQYDSTQSLLSIVEQKSAWYQTNQVGFWNSWIADVFDIRTANTFGLNVWGIIVGISRNLTVGTGGGQFGLFGGFNNMPFNSVPFNFGGWSSSVYGSPSSYQVSNDLYRKMIIAKAMTNVSKNTIPALNAVLSVLFEGRGGIYYVDNHDMTMTLNYNFALTPVDYAIITQSNVLSRPAAVLLRYKGFTRAMFGGFNTLAFNTVPFNNGGFLN